MKLTLIAIAGVLTLVSGLAFAEHDHACGKGKFDKTNWQQHRVEQFEKHQARLHTMLQLTTTQETAWQTFQTQIKPDDKVERPDFASLEKLTTPQRLDTLAAWDKERDSKQAQRATAIRTFYAQLNDAQKKVFDENAVPPHMGKGHGDKHPE